MDGGGLRGSVSGGYERGRERRVLEGGTGWRGLVGLLAGEGVRGCVRGCERRMLENKKALVRHSYPPPLRGIS